MRPTKEIKQYYYGQIALLSNGYAVGWLCGMFGVSRSGYYKWKTRGDRPNRYVRSRQILDEHIQELHQRHPSSGYRALNARLRSETGWVVCNVSVLRSMQRLGIRAKVRKNRRGPMSGTENKKFPNLLHRQFHAPQPLTRVVTDITHFTYQKRKYAFICYLDLFNNEILEWNVGASETMDLILPPLRRLLQRERPASPRMLLHSDQGTQFAAAGFVSLLRDHGVIQSMSRAGTPRDNAVIESIFGWFKDFLRSEYLSSRTDPIENILADAVYDFNHFRPSCKLHYKSPVQFRLDQGF